MKLSRLAFSNSPFKWPLLVLTVAALAYLSYCFIGFCVHAFCELF